MTTDETLFAAALTVMIVLYFAGLFVLWWIRRKIDDPEA